MTVQPIEGAPDARVTNDDALWRDARDMAAAATERGSTDMTPEGCVRILREAEDRATARAATRRRAAEWVAMTVDHMQRGRWYGYADVLAAGMAAGHRPTDLTEAIGSALGVSLTKSGMAEDTVLTPRM